MSRREMTSSVYDEKRVMSDDLDSIGSEAHGVVLTGLSERCDRICLFR